MTDAPARPAMVTEAELRALQEKAASPRLKLGHTAKNGDTELLDAASGGLVGLSHCPDNAALIVGAVNSLVWNPVLEDGSCDHEWEGDGDGGWPACKHCDKQAPDDYFYRDIHD